MVVLGRRRWASVLVVVEEGCAVIWKAWILRSTVSEIQTFPNLDSGFVYKEMTPHRRDVKDLFLA